jgi:hypothetical protein
MTNAVFYRGEAKRYRERAASSNDPHEAEQFLRFAREHDTLAALIEESEGADEQPARQRQQQKKKSEDDK